MMAKRCCSKIESLALQLRETFAQCCECWKVGVPECFVYRTEHQSQYDLS